MSCPRQNQPNHSPEHPSARKPALGEGERRRRRGVGRAWFDEYTTFAEKMAALAKKHGAIEYVNCLADDVKPGKETSFPQAVKLRSDEIVVSSWAVYSSRADRDRANQAIMVDEAFKELAKNIPVDMKRMFSGGFKVLSGL